MAVNCDTSLQHSDMGEHERRVVLQGFKAALETSAADTAGSPPLGDVWEMDGLCTAHSILILSLTR